MDANTNDLSTDLTNNTDGVILSHSAMNDSVTFMPNNTSRQDDRLVVLPSPPRHAMAGNAAGNDLSRNIPVPLAPSLSGRNDKESLERVPNIELPRSVINDSKVPTPNRLLNDSQEDNDRRPLTALSILESSRRGMIDLELTHREALLCRRSRSFNKGGGYAFLRPTLEKTAPKPDTAFTAALKGVTEGDLLHENRFLSMPLSERMTDSSETFFGSLNESCACNSYEIELSRCLHNLSPRGMVELEPKQQEAMTSIISIFFSEEGASEGIAPRPGLRRAIHDIGDHSFAQGHGNGDNKMDTYCM